MRVLLVTGDASLGVTLAFEDPSRELVVVGSIAEARERGPETFDTCVIDIGSTPRGERAAELLRDLGLERSLVIGGERRPPSMSDGCAYLARPFSMPELELALDRLAPRRARRGQVRRRWSIGRLFESWTGGAVPGDTAPVQGDAQQPMGRPAPEEPPAVVRTLARPDGETIRDPHGDHVTRRLREHLEATYRIEDLLTDQPHLADLDEVAIRTLRSISDGLLTVHVSLWVQRADGSHVRVPRGDGRGSGRLESGHPLLEALSGAVEAVLVDRLPHPWFDGTTGGIDDDQGRLVGTAAALRTGDRYHGAVVAFGSGFTTDDRDRLVGLAGRAAPQIALATALNRLGVGARLFRTPAVEPVR